MALAGCHAAVVFGASAVGDVARGADRLGQHLTRHLYTSTGTVRPRVGRARVEAGSVPNFVQLLVLVFGQAPDVA